MGPYRKMSSFNKKMINMKFVAQSKNFSDILTMAALMAAEPLWTRVKVPTSPKNTRKMLIIVATGRVILGKHDFNSYLMAALMAAAFCNICGMTSISI